MTQPPHHIKLYYKTNCNPSSTSCCPHLIVPGFPAEHLSTLETRCQTPGSEGSVFWEKLHVDTLSKVDEDEAVVQVL